VIAFVEPANVDERDDGTEGAGVPIKVRAMIKVAEGDGWEQVSQRGSHRVKGLRELGEPVPCRPPSMLSS